ncbi:sigma-54-dependent transcriptional regulator FlbD [Parapedomonas caeni]
MRLLMVGHLGGQLATASKMAMAAGAKVTHAPEAAAALDIVRTRGADLIMIDVACDIASFIDQIRSERIATEVVACGIGTDARAAVTAIRAGAKEYVPLPPDAELIAAVIQAVAEDSHQLIFRDPAMGRVIGLVDQIAPSDASILITGESGTGKEIIARYIHKKSNRADRPFVAVNCAAIPENLLESELFGHEKGAFTGAVARRVGKFEEANGGTLLLDEISEMDIRLQAKLLRAIQERQIDRVGGAHPVPVNIRILATSNRNLADEVKKGTFREDLLFRLNVVNVKLPPLRERPADLKVLAEHFAQKYAESNRMPTRPIDETALRALLTHAWPGNVRELENTMHRAVLLAMGETISADAIVLPDGSRPAAAPVIAASDDAESNADGTAPTGTLVGRTVADVERDLIIDTLKHCLGNRTHAANILGISIRTLRNKLNEYTAAGMNVPAPGLNERAAY